MTEQAPTDVPATLSWALFYHSLGWSVIPAHRLAGASCSCQLGPACVSPGKHPAIAWTPFQTQRAGLDQIKAWFTGPYREYGIGIITGAASGNLFVVDVDQAPGKEGADTLHFLQMHNDDLPETCQAITGGGGRHYLFTAPAGIRIKTDRNILGPGVDTRGEGGFIVAAPSLHASGRYYLWDERHHPAKLKPADAPPWLLALIESGAERAQPNGATGAHANGIDRTAFGFVGDGREKYMVQVICGCIGSYVRANGTLPEPIELFAEAWPTYERNVKARSTSLDADQRGEALMRQRIGYLLHRAATGKFPVLQQIADEIAQAAFKEGIAGRPHPVVEPEQSSGEYPLPFIWFDAVQPSIDAIDFVEGILCTNQMSVVYGESNCGKTFFMTDLAFHIATGRRWRDREVDRGGVIYVALEGSFGIKNRLSALKKHYGMEGQKIPLAVVATSINMLDPKADTGKLIALIKQASAEIGMPILLVVIDTLARAFAGGNENAPEDMGAVVINADRIRMEAPTALAFVHHSGKDQARGARGHNSLRAATDTEIEVTRQEGADFSVATVVKQRELETGGAFAFRLEKVELGTNRRGKPVTSCIVKSVDDNSISIKATRPLSPKEIRALDVLKNVFVEHSIPAPAGHNLPNVRVVKIETFRAELGQSGITTRDIPGTERKQWERIRDGLDNKGIIRMYGEWIWIA